MEASVQLSDQIDVYGEVTLVPCGSMNPTTPCATVTATGARMHLEERAIHARPVSVNFNVGGRCTLGYARNLLYLTVNAKVNVYFTRW